MPGYVFSDQIADMIKSGCRKTIIILSPNYIESEWCSYEARLALHQSPGSHGNRTCHLNYEPRTKYFPVLITGNISNQIAVFSGYLSSVKLCMLHFANKLYLFMR